MLNFGRVTEVKVLFLVLVFAFKFDLFKFSAAILEKGLWKIGMDNRSLDNSCFFISLSTIIYQQFRTRCCTKYEVRRVLVNTADRLSPMAQSSLEGPLENIFFCHLGSINWGKMIGLLKSDLYLALFHRLE